MRGSSSVVVSFPIMTLMEAGVSQIRTVSLVLVTRQTRYEHVMVMKQEISGSTAAATTVPSDQVQSSNHYANIRAQDAHVLANGITQKKDRQTERKQRKKKRNKRIKKK
eukprot:TRINITY_DN5007_c0_g1_i7.p2 TRINITY_DN5007_c0_g1~~TRINITY_DN5007_c0_g1_i7.p2  ORF type:complete len:109 (+),score=10.73 TRINITY_DN5007_c0_g1_i7:215-541(+)